jgi:hypothetical protein
MKKAPFIAVLLCLPLGILVIALFRRAEADRKMSAVSWFDQLPLPQPSANADTLKKMGKTAMPVLQRELKSQDARNRIKAAWALGQLGSIASNAVPDLVEALNDDSAMVRTYAIQSLAAIDVLDEDLVPKIMAKLGDSALPVNDSALNLLDKIENEEKARGVQLPVDEYEYAMAYVNGASQRGKLLGMQKLKGLPQDDERVVAAVNSLLNETNDWIRQQAFLILKGQLPPPESNVAPASVTNAVTTPP